MWLLTIILLELIVVLVIGYFIVKRLTSKPKQIPCAPQIVDAKMDNYAIERAVQNGVVSAIKQIDADKIREKNIIESARRENSVGNVYTTTDPSDEPVKYSGGNLVPFNLSESEKEVLNMFFGKD
jgi:hypothetical protein